MVAVVVAKDALVRVEAEVEGQEVGYLLGWWALDFVGQDLDVMVAQQAH